MLHKKERSIETFYKKRDSFLPFVIENDDKFIKIKNRT